MLMLRLKAQPGNGVMFGLVVMTILVTSGILVTSKIGQTTDTQYTRSSLNQTKADAGLRVAKQAVFDWIQDKLAKGETTDLETGDPLPSRNLCLPNDPAHVGTALVVPDPGVITGGLCANISTTGTNQVDAYAYSQLGSFSGTITGKRGNFYQTAINVVVGNETFAFTPPANVEPDICAVVETKVRENKVNELTTDELKDYARKPCMLRGNYAYTPASSGTCSTPVTGTGALEAGTVAAGCSIASSQAMNSVAFGDLSGAVSLTSNNGTSITPRLLYFNNIQTSGANRLDASSGLHHVYLRNVSNGSLYHLFNGSLFVTGTLDSSTLIRGSTGNDTLAVTTTNTTNGFVEMGDTGETGHDRVFLGGPVAGTVEMWGGQNLLYAGGAVTGTIKATGSSGKNLFIFGDVVTGATFTGLTTSDNVVLCKAGKAGCDSTPPSWAAREIPY
jgi:hypothetical protein